MSANDPQILLVKKNTNAPSDQMDYTLFYRTVDKDGNPVEQPLSLCGFSFFDEVSGYLPGGEPGLDLWSDKDTVHPPDGNGKYGLTYDDYLNTLYNAHINYVRLFLFNLEKVRLYPFVKEKDQAGKERFHLDVIDTTYMDRLSEFVRKARDRGIVVCISLSAIQAIKGGFADGPFYSKNNYNKVVIYTSGLKDYCVIKNPLGNNPDDNLDIPYDNNWTDESLKLYSIQHKLFKAVVDATKPYWNVFYELLNEPDDEILEVREWHKTVARWLNSFLKDGSNPRTRLISITGVDDKSNTLDNLVSDLQGKVDIVSLHGNQWGGPSGEAGNVCNSGPVPSASVIRDGTKNADGTKDTDGIKDAITRFRGKGLAVIFDGDALYWSQRKPTDYVSQALAKKGSFNYRWGNKFINRVDILPDSNTTGDHCHTSSNELGIYQRLELMQAPNIGSVTKLPRPPAPTPKDLTATFEGGTLKLKFSRPAPPIKPTDPDTKPEGYIVYLGSSAETVGQGAPLLPAYKYFQVSDPEHPQYSLPVLQGLRAAEAYVAVAAYNGTFVSARSNVVRVTIPLGVIGSALVDAQLPVGSGATITSRNITGSVTFKNTGTAAWLKQETIAGGGMATRGLYLKVPEVWSEAGRIFIPMDPPLVLPGQTVKFQINNLLPYWRQPMHLTIAMGEFQQSSGSSSLGEFGTIYDHLNTGAPLEVEVTNPKRHATLMIDHPGIWPLPNAIYLEPKLLSGTNDSWNYDAVSCTTTSTANPGTIIRWFLDIETVGGQTSRVVRLQHNGSASLGINLRVVRLDNKDIDVPPHPDTLSKGFNLNAGQKAFTSLDRFETRYSVTTATSKTIIPAGPTQTISWNDMLKAGTPPLKQLEVNNHSSVAALVSTWTNEIWENLPTGQQDPRQIISTEPLSFAPGETVKYVKLSNANEHHYHLVSLHTNGAYEVRYNIVLRANDHKNFERVLEVGVAPRSQTFEVDYKILDVLIDALA
ncbi:MAG: hypothetical protein WCB68_13190 [Pyrinomonadaceae bacterium]